MRKGIAMKRGLRIISVSIATNLALTTVSALHVPLAPVTPIALPRPPAFLTHCRRRNVSPNCSVLPCERNFIYSLQLQASSSSVETGNPPITQAVDQQSPIEFNASPHAETIFAHVENASKALSQNDVVTQQSETENAERKLIQWVNDFRGKFSSGSSGSDSNNDARKSDANVESGVDQTIDPPKAEIFNQVIHSLLALPSSYENSISDRGSPVVCNEDASTNDAVVEEQKNEQLRSLIGKGSRKVVDLDINSKSDRAVSVLDLMESFHEPSGAIYDEIIASFGSDALECLSLTTSQERSEEICSLNEGDEGVDALEEKETIMYSTASKDSPYYKQAWKSAKAALQLLNRSEELYRETGKLSSRLPSISSYVTVMDIWKALAVSAESDEKKKRDEALEIVRNLRQRRLDVYSLNNAESDDDGAVEGKYTVLPPNVTNSVRKVLDFASNLLGESVPSYKLKVDKNSKIGTWHFNQLIFDLAKNPQSYSGHLAQDLLEFMVYTVKKSSSKGARQSNPTVPKPNADTINGVLKAWMVTPNLINTPDAARRAEAVLAKLAVWQADSIFWDVSPDIVSYNTCINCWKNSGVRGAAQRATDILTILEDEENNVTPDVISYASCIGAWAECAGNEPGAGKRAEELLVRMYQRSRDASSTLPRPTTRCFNAVLLAYANSGEEGGGKRALDLLRFMEKLDSEGYDDVKPDSFTLNIVMKALANCGESGAADKANQLLRRMEQSHGNGDIRLQPDLLSYNTVLDSFAKKGDAESAEKLLSEMYRLSDKGETGEIAKPNTYSYTTVLNAWANHEDKALAVQRAEELFDDLERKYAAGETDIRADTSVYNALINCWAKSGDKKALYRVTQILNLMEELGLQGGDSEVEPNSRTYCSVLHTLARSKNWKAVDQSMEILKRMEDFYSEGFESVRPCARAYSIVISTIARSRKKGKAIMAQELLHQMESEYRKGNTLARPTVYSYNAVLNAAAFTNGDEREQEDAFKVACLTFDELRMSDYLQPTHVSYGTFLKAVNNLMPKSDVRDELVKGVFRRCCRDGQVGDLVLRNMKSLSSPESYQSLLGGVSGYGLPKSWSANVRERNNVIRT